MVDCVSITREKVRAKLSIGGFSIETPDVKSFSVLASRGNPIRTMSATLEIVPDFSSFVSISLPDQDQINPEQVPVVLRAGSIGEYFRNGQSQVLYNTIDELPIIFRGFVVDARLSPSWDRTDRVILNIQCKDVFYRLEGRGVSRRNPWRHNGRWVAIRGIHRKATSPDSVTSGANIGNVPTKGIVPDLHMSGSKPRVIETPEIIDYTFSSLEKPKTQSLLRMSPEVIYAIGGQTSVTTLDYAKNNRYDYSSAVNIDTGIGSGDTGVLDFTERWVMDEANPFIVIKPCDEALDDGLITEDDIPENIVDPADVRCATIQFLDNFVPGTITGITFSSDQIDPNSGKSRIGRIIIQSVLPHTHENMVMGGSAFGTFG